MYDVAPVSSVCVSAFIHVYETNFLPCTTNQNSPLSKNKLQDLIPTFHLLLSIQAETATGTKNYWQKFLIGKTLFRKAKFTNRTKHFNTHQETAPEYQKAIEVSKFKYCNKYLPKTLIYNPQKNWRSLCYPLHL